MYKLENIDYKKVFYYFEKISDIPRGSGNNKGISDYLVNFAIEHGFRYVQDEYLNVIIYKEASQGLEDKKGVILQAHMDMVCEKISENTHDFINDGLELLYDDEYIYANGTTLGGDDGIGVAYALAYLDDDTNIHPSIEVLITTDEETGMNGSIGLDGSLIKGKYLLNLDSEDEGVLLCSCAGGMSASCSVPLERENTNGIKVSISIKGLKGGHSGTEINKNRQNATILMARLLMELKKKNNIRILNIMGGYKDNVIPCEAQSDIVIDRENIDLFMSDFSFITEYLKNELTASEPNLNIFCEKDNIEQEFLVLNTKTCDIIINVLLLVPNGVLSMSSSIENLVESSANLGVCRTSDSMFETVHSIRSSVNDYKKYTFDRINLLYTMSRGNVRIKSEYPAWEFRKNSALLGACSEVFKEQYGYDAKIQAIHAGLECGILSEKIEEADIVSFGPDILDIHTVKERMNIESVKRTYDLMEKIIARTALI